MIDFLNIEDFKEDIENFEKENSIEEIYKHIKDIKKIKKIENNKIEIEFKWKELYDFIEKNKTILKKIENSKISTMRDNVNSLPKFKSFVTKKIKKVVELIENKTSSNKEKLKEVLKGNIDDEKNFDELINNIRNEKKDYEYEIFLLKLRKFILSNEIFKESFVIKKIMEELFIVTKYMKTRD
ncbi:hypothetical protein [Streptobacillus canis]|uniref:hypothetical protein n=1 Tax=Streptobacillus canis TaxID=2678686 RepID=UPI0012E24342|nr:hypothetical protein [Streptobacillus canis]